MSTEMKKADDLRDSIFRLEDYIINNLPPAELEWVHRFTPGMYSREGIVPAGVLVTGSIHKTEHISVFLEGKMVIPDGEGGSEVIEAPRVEICQPGAKRVGVAVERVRWITFHPTELTTVAECEDAFFTNDPTEVPTHLAQFKIIDETGYAMLQRSCNGILERITED